jgi:hypothetical protein
MAEILTVEQINEKAAELELREKCKIHQIVLEVNGEQIVGFVREPKRQTKLAAIDKFWAGETTSACEDVLTSSLIEDSSDRRILSQSPEHDDIYISATMACLPIVKLYTNAVKKN